MERSGLRYRWVFCILLAMGLTGCLTVHPSQPSRFYVLSPQAEANPASKSAEPSILIGVGPVEIPEYLNRAQIVTRVSANEIRLWEFDRWAEPLNENMTRVLSENLSNLVCCMGEEEVMVFPGRISARTDYKVEIGVIRFDGALEKDVTLIVLWRILGSSGDKPLVTKRGEYVEPVFEDGHEALVAAESRAVLSLSRDIAEAFARILKGAEKPPRSGRRSS